MTKKVLKCKICGSEQLEEISDKRKWIEISNRERIPKISAKAKKEYWALVKKSTNLIINNR